MNPQNYLNSLNRDYLNVHRQKEDLFWTTYMGTSNDQAGSAAAETKWNQFLSDPERLSQIQQQLEQLNQLDSNEETQLVKQGLQGWLATFKAHALPTEESRQLKADLIKFESDLFEKKQNYTQVFIDADGNEQQGSLPVLAANIRTSDHEAVRKSSHQALLDVEQWLLHNGFLDLVKLRNKFARSLGFDNFFDYSIVKTEQMSTDELFAILDDFEQRTRDSNLRSLQELAAEKGDSAVEAHNFVFSFSGDAMRDLDQYVPFSQSLRRWIESFGRLNITYANAELTLDLLDRKGKYPNGFCHGPIPSFVDENSQWVAAKVNFTSNAKPDQVGSGYDGINTLFHEGGHAAHFSNVKMNAPCFAQEFAPTSMAYAETQSMFCDSLLGDGDWLKLYALNEKGEAISDDVIKAMVESKQPFRAYGERSILVVPYFERALYQLSEQELTPENVTRLARETEQKIQGLACSPRPLMAIPHLLSDESACAYQGYLLAHMAVYQTRAYFTKKFGFLTDNPEIGPLLEQHYWRQGNAVNHNQTIIQLTGEGFNAKYLADECNLTSEQAWDNELQKIAGLADRERASVHALDARISIVDGDKELANNELSDEQMCQGFERYIVETYGR
ncbi:M3 family metallopeptidase [Vibrio neonatus]|uniref:M3 family metallopeptidase n=1 Tax=Vibrio neonatus TaxID=278860 RepID=UPI0021C3CF34|nr:M3 family metallopeptidase [Vibrio neonatus]